MSQLQKKAQSRLHKKKNKSKLFSFLSSTIQLILLIAIITIIFLSYSHKINILKNNNLAFYTVISGSMEPTIPVASIIKLKHISKEDLKIGDIITYQVPQNKQMSGIVTHRITQIEKSDDNLIITTKGDANNIEDQYTITYQNIIGVYDFHIPRIGYFIEFSKSKTGIIILIVFPLITLIIWESISLTLNIRSRFFKD